MVPGPAKAFQCGEGKALRLKVCFWAGLGQTWGRLGASRSESFGFKDC